MKKVVSPEQVAHLFANKLQEEAYTQTRNLYFYKNCIYSYGYHFCIAKFVDDETLLFTEQGYSNTTEKHIKIVSYATSHKDKIYCANPTGTHEENFKYWLNEAEYISKKLINARKPEIYIGQLETIKAKAIKYANYFKIAIPLTLEKILSITDKAEIVAYYETKKSLIESEAKAKAKKEAKEHAKELKEWRTFKKVRLYSRIGYDYIRKDHENFETSQGIKIPISVGLRFYNNMKQGLTGSKFMNFDINEITKDYISIGCHKITFKEIEKSISI
jgi:hypothetical protein